MTGPWALTWMGSYESQESQATGSEFSLQDLLAARPTGASLTLGSIAVATGPFALSTPEKVRQRMDFLACCREGRRRNNRHRAHNLQP